MQECMTNNPVNALNISSAGQTTAVVPISLTRTRRDYSAAVNRFQPGARARTDSFLDELEVTDML
eukprot:6212784-Pleurochrysis_carterae.AAC.1